MVIIAAILALIAIPVLLLGLRGRVVDDHPICAKCRFDLVGVYPEADVCPECGKTLPPVEVEGMLERPAVVYGNRKRRAGLIKLSLAALVPAVLVLSAAATLAIMGRDLAYYKPTWMLKSELGSASITTADAAGRELQRRLDANGISADKIPEIIEEALDRQADGGLPWAPLVGSLIESAIDSNQASSKQHHRYLRNSVSHWRVDPQERLHSGDQLSYGITIEDARVGTSGVVNIDFNLSGAALDGKSIELIEVPFSPTYPNPTMHIWSLGVDRSSGLSGRAPQPPILVLPPIEGEPGRRDVVLTYDFVAFDQIDDLTPMYEWQVDFKASVEIRAPEQMLVELAMAPSKEMAARMRDSIKFDGMSGSWYDKAYNDPPRELHVNWTARFDNIPMDVAFDIYIAQDGQEWDFDSLKKSNGARGVQGDYSLMQIGDGPNIKSGTIDLILRPNSELASRHPSMTEIWGEELVIKGIRYDAPID